MNLTLMSWPRVPAGGTSRSRTGGLGFRGSGWAWTLPVASASRPGGAVVAAEGQLPAVRADREGQGRLGLLVVDLALDHAGRVPGLDAAVLAQ